MEAVSPSITVTTYKSIWCNNPADQHWFSHCYENLKSLLLFSFLVMTLRCGRLFWRTWLLPSSRWTDWCPGMRNFAIWLLDVQPKESRSECMLRSEVLKVVKMCWSSNTMLTCRFLRNILPPASECILLFRANYLYFLLKRNCCRWMRQTKQTVTVGEEKHNSEIWKM